MQRLPVIVGFGGYNAAGRSSSHHGFRRMIIDALASEERYETIAGLAVMMGLVSFDGLDYRSGSGDKLSLSEVADQYWEEVRAGTLVRRMLKTERMPLSKVNSSGQLPAGFDVSALYKSRFHPRNLQLTVCGASDALHSIGIEWDQIVDTVKPDEIAVYVGSIFGQMDEFSLAGAFKAYEDGRRVSAKQLPLSLNTMPADFINAYVLGSVGTTGCVTGACATFLYNLKAGIESIQSGESRVVVVGASEAPVTPEIIDGFAAMNALATTDGLKKLEDNDSEPDYQKSSRPFGLNCGFTMAEGAQFVILMDDKLAIDLGAQIHGAATHVFVNADGFKKSISAPGAGNYITLAKAMAAAKGIVGDEGLSQRSFIHAHGSSTPANRTTESEMLNNLAQSFNIANWPVTAVKAFVGHSLGPASGDQVIAALGSFKYGIIPGISSIKNVAEDVRQDYIDVLTENQIRRCDELDVAFINSKGFGGNNATGVLLSPVKVEQMLRLRYGAKEFERYCLRREACLLRSSHYDLQAVRGDFNVIYNADKPVINVHDIEVAGQKIKLPGFINCLTLNSISQYADMLESVS